MAQRGTRLWATLAGALALAACDGGGGGGTPAPTPTPTPTPPPVNAAPTFTSGTTGAVAENIAATTVVYQAAATDPEGSAVNFGLAGGPDAAQFTMSATGELRFVASPDYELPSDSDQDNLYSVDIVAGDGTALTRRTIQVTVTNVREGDPMRAFCGSRGCKLVQQQVAAFLIPEPRPLAVKELVVAQRNGLIVTVWDIDDNFANDRQIPNVATDGDRGVIAMTPAPDFATSGNFYVMYANTAGDIVIHRFSRQGFLYNGTDPGTVMLTIPHAQYNNNLGGWMGWGPDGNLYVATGDGGGVGDPLNTAQDPASRLGKVLRISPDFATVTIAASGFRNPGGGSFYNNMLVLSDRGQDLREEINLVPLTGPAGNYGWPFKEGTVTVRAGGPAGMVDPMAECAHAPGTRGCYGLIGGYVYEGTNPTLQGQYIFGERNYFDAANGINRGGYIFTLPVTALVPGQPTLTQRSFAWRTLDLFYNISGVIDPTSFSKDSSGRIYMTVLSDRTNRVNDTPYVWRIN